MFKVVAKGYSKSLSGKNLTVQSDADLTLDTLGNVDNITVTNSSNLDVKEASSISSGAIGVSYTSKFDAPKLTVKAGGDVTVENGAKLCVKSVEMNNLKVRAGSLVKAENLDVQIGAEILNYGTVYTDKFTCGNVRQDALNSNLIVTGKLIVTEGNDSYLYSAGINSFVVKGHLKIYLVIKSVHISQIHFM